MNFGWFLLINGIIGVIVFYGTYIPFMIWLSMKYGEQNADDGLDNVKYESDTFGEHFVKNRMDIWILFAYFATFFLWEIELPIKYFVIWQHVKNLNDIQGHKEEKSHE